jgi:hypothetical protein
LPVDVTAQAYVTLLAGVQFQRGDLRAGGTDDTFEHDPHGAALSR